MKHFTITRANFLDWYFNGSYDQDNEEIKLELAERVINLLYKSKKNAVITLNEIFDECNHDVIRLSELEEFNSEDIDEELNRKYSDIELGELNYEWTLKLI